MSTCVRQLVHSLLPLSTILAPVAAAYAGVRQVDYPPSGVDLGVGWNSEAEGKTTASCVRFKKVTPLSQDKIAQVYSVTDTSSLNEAFEVSASFRIKAIAGGASGTAKFTHNLAIDQNSSNFAVRARVMNSAEYVAPLDIDGPDTNFLVHGLSPEVNARTFQSAKIELTGEAAEWAITDRDKFKRVCGDSFVSAISSGATFLGVISFSETSRQERTDINVTAQASGTIWNAQGAFSAKMAEFEKNNRLNIQVIEQGGSGGTIPLDREKMLAAVQNLPQAAVQAPKRFSIELTDYSSLASWPSSPLDIRLTERQKIAQSYYKLWSLYRSMEHMVASPNKYYWAWDVSLESLKLWQDIVFGDLKSLEAMAVECDAGTRCVYDNNALSHMSDYTYRSHLPVPLAYLGWSRQPRVGDDIMDIDTNTLAQEYIYERHQYWVQGPSSQRCLQFSDCITNEVRDRLAYDITRFVMGNAHAKMPGFIQLFFDNQSRFNPYIKVVYGDENKMCSEQPKHLQDKLLSGDILYTDIAQRYCFCVALSRWSLDQCTLQEGSNELVVIRRASEIEIPIGTRFGIDGGAEPAASLQKISATTWHELRGSQHTYTFKDEGRDGNYLQLSDPSRGIRVRVPFAGGMSWWRAGDGPWKALWAVSVAD